MARFTAGLFVLFVVGFLVGPTLAQQPTASDCEKWVNMINAEAGRRFDSASYDARQKAPQIAEMCKQGKLAEAEKAAKETLASIGVQP